MNELSKISPKSLKNTGNALQIEWSDDITHTLPWRDLRKACPCAVCRTQPPTPETSENENLLPVITPQEAQPLKVASMIPMGNYAYEIGFSDGHNSGIYSLDYLREIGETLSRVR